MKKIIIAGLLIHCSVLPAFAEYFSSPELGGGEHQTDYPSESNVNIRSRVVRELQDRGSVTCEYIDQGQGEFKIIEKWNITDVNYTQEVITIDSSEFGGRFLVSFYSRGLDEKSYVFKKGDIYRYIYLKLKNGAWSVDIVCDFREGKLLIGGDEVTGVELDEISTFSYSSKTQSGDEMTQCSIIGSEPLVNGIEISPVNHRRHLTLTPDGWRGVSESRFASVIKKDLQQAVALSDEEFMVGMTEYLAAVPAADREAMLSRLMIIKNTPIESFIGLTVAEANVLAEQLNLSHRTISIGGIIQQFHSSSENPLLPTDMYFVVGDDGRIEYVNVLSLGPHKLSIP